MIPQQHWSGFLLGGACEVAVQGGFGDAGLGGDDAEGIALRLQEPCIFDLVFRMGDRSADVAVARFGDGAGVGGARVGRRWCCGGPYGGLSRRPPGRGRCTAQGSVGGPTSDRGRSSRPFSSQ